MSKWIITPDKYLTAEELSSLRRVCEDNAIIAISRGNQSGVRDRLIIEMALGTGLRVSELCSLRIENINLKRGQNSLLVKNGKGNKDRLVAFSSNLKNLIGDYLNYRSSESPFLFPSERGDKMTRHGISKVFKKLALKASLPSHFSIHSLRHTYATNLYKASGYNLRLVQKQLGHSSITTTSVYSDVISDDLEKAVEKLN